MANKYTFQLRRGWKDDASGRDDWAAYEAMDDHIKPLAGELVLIYDNGIPRLKIGDGEHEFSELPYMSVDSFILPKPISITLSNTWNEATGENGELNIDGYYQVVTVDNAVITPTSKVDLQPTPQQICDFKNNNVILSTENDGGIIRVYLIGEPLTKEYVVQATVTEVALNG